jgi:membrane-associated phospholipid phosphatase
MAPTRFALSLAALAVLWLAMLLLGAGGTDRALLRQFYADHPSLAHAARLLTELGGSPVLLPAAVAAALAGWLLRRDWRAPAWYLGMTLAGRLLVELQKGWTMRLRPDAHEQLAPVTSYAFPSGHAANATMVWLGAAFLLAQGKARPWALAAAAFVAFAVGLTRPMLGVHWPSDIAAGWSLGLFWTLLWVRLAEQGGTAGRSGALSP